MVSIIIINYNQKDYLIECVKSIRENISYPHEVIVINNSPGENLSGIGVAAVYPSSNLGFSHANNFGVKHSKGEYLLFLNADTAVRNDFLGKLVDEFGEKDFGAAGLKLFNEDGSFQLSFWKENTFANERYNKKSERKFKERDSAFIKEAEENHNKITEVDWVSGAAMFMRKNVFDEIGGFDEDFFLFYEDADICKRLSAKGYKIYFFPYSEILHYKGENVNKDFSDKTYFYSKKSQILYYSKHNSLTDRILLRIYLILKFAFLYLVTFKKINMRILLLSLGLKKSP